MSNAPPKGLYSFIWHFIRPYKAWAITFVMLAIFAGCWGPFNSMIVKHIINLLPTTQTDGHGVLIWPAVLIVLNFLIFDNFTWRSLGFLNYKFQPIIKNQIISEMFEFVLGASHQFFQDNLSGRIGSNINTLADGIEHILHRISMDFIRGFSLLIVAFVGVYWVDARFFWTLFVWLVVFFSFSVLMSKRLVALSDVHAGCEAATSGQLLDSITNVGNVRVFAKKAYEALRLQKFLMPMKKAFRNNERFLLLLHTVQGLMIAIMLGFMVYFLVHLHAQHLITPGDFALVLGISMEVGHMTWYTMSQVDEFNQEVGRCKQSLACLIVPHSICDAPKAYDLVVKKGRIEFRDLKFHYKGATPLFDGLSVTIDGGQKVGLVGYSGSGKTTFVNLILRLYEVTDGDILIDNQNIAEVRQDSLRRSIGLIPQDPSLFHRSIIENIRYGRIEATDEEVIHAAKMAHAHEFITALPEGYDALVGERGIKLSGGQRQRIAIARAMLKNAPILILDEATSQLDSITEEYIQQSLWVLINGGIPEAEASMDTKTVIIIAHRLSTLLNMDRILVFDEGKIVQDGTHRELIHENGLYKTLWNAQVCGFLPEKKA